MRRTGAIRCTLVTAGTVPVRPAVGAAGASACIGSPGQGSAPALSAAASPGGYRPRPGCPAGSVRLACPPVIDPSPLFRALATTPRPRGRRVPAQRDLTLAPWQQRARMFAAGVPVD